jgi:hypothetical protein
MQSTQYYIELSPLYETCTLNELEFLLCCGMPTRAHISFLLKDIIISPCFDSFFIHPCARRIDADCNSPGGWVIDHLMAYSSRDWCLVPTCTMWIYAHC